MFGWQEKSRHRSACLVEILVVHAANRRNSAFITSSPAPRRPGGRRTALSAGLPPFGSLGCARCRSARSRLAGRRVAGAGTHGAAALHAWGDTSAETACLLPLRLVAFAESVGWPHARQWLRPVLVSNAICPAAALRLPIGSPPCLITYCGNREPPALHCERASADTRISVGFRVQWILQVLQRGRSPNARRVLRNCLWCRIGSVTPAIRAGPHSKRRHLPASWRSDRSAVSRRIAHRLLHLSWATSLAFFAWVAAVVGCGSGGNSRRNR